MRGSRQGASAPAPRWRVDCTGYDRGKREYCGFSGYRRGVSASDPRVTKPCPRCGAGMQVTPLPIEER